VAFLSLVSGRRRGPRRNSIMCRNGVNGPALGREGFGRESKVGHKGEKMHGDAGAVEGHTLELKEGRRRVRLGEKSYRRSSSEEAIKWFGRRGGEGGVGTD